MVYDRFCVSGFLYVRGVIYCGYEMRNNKYHKYK